MNNVRTYLKEHSQFIFSIILMIMIPILIVANTLWQIRRESSFQTTELTSKTKISETILANSVNIKKNTAAEIQAQIEKITGENTEIKEITILTPEADGFTVLASTNNQNLGLKFNSEDYVKAFTSDTPISNIVKDTSKTPNERFITISTPVKDNLTDTKLAIATLKISLTVDDNLIHSSTSNSLVILVATIFLVLLLLINNFRFFEYAISYKKLDEVDKMKDDFISIASHEMKTPMAAIKGYISMMLEGLVGKFDDKTKDHLLKINTNVQRLDLLLSETLDVSRLEQGRMQFDMVPIDFSNIIKKSIAILQDQATAKNLNLTEEKLDSLPMVFADPDRLQQVADNIIGNAIKYTQKGGVSISYKMDNGKLLTTIKDTGIGMNEADCKSLFTKFYRIKNEKTVDIPGTGLGLWIAREIIRKMNGDIIVKSQENAGSEFTIVLPYMDEK